MNKHGGAREGAGAKPLPLDQKAKVRSIKVTDADWSKLDRLAKKGGESKTSWLVSKIREDKE